MWDTRWGARIADGVSYDDKSDGGLRGVRDATVEDGDWEQEMFKEDEELELEREQAALKPDGNVQQGQVGGKRRAAYSLWTWTKNGRGWW